MIVTDSLYRLNGRDAFFNHPIRQRLQRFAAKRADDGHGIVDAVLDCTDTGPFPFRPALLWQIFEGPGISESAFACPGQLSAEINTLHDDGRPETAKNMLLGRFESRMVKLPADHLLLRS